MPEEGRPDYLIYWVRDALFVYYAFLAELEIAGNTDVALREYADNFVHILRRTQQVYNPSGTSLTGGLEEALFDIHIRKLTYPAEYRIGSPAAGMPSFFFFFFLLGSRFSHKMTDGPPLRALVMLKYAEWLLQPQQNNGTWVADVLWPSINLDLQWIGQHWNESSYVWNALQVTAHL